LLSLLAVASAGRVAMPAFLLLSLPNTCRVKIVQQIEISTRAANTACFDHWHPFIGRLARCGGDRCGRQMRETQMRGLPEGPTGRKHGLLAVHRPHYTRYGISRWHL
jgi:hypothetical protein